MGQSTQLYWIAMFHLKFYTYRHCKHTSMHFIFGLNPLAQALGDTSLLDFYIIFNHFKFIPPPFLTQANSKVFSVVVRLTKHIT